MCAKGKERRLSKMRKNVQSEGMIDSECKGIKYSNSEWKYVTGCANKMCYTMR